jgi:integrase
VSIQCYDGEIRARIYILSYMTGLRRTEIASMTPRSFRLDADPPTLTVQAACSKHRREDTLPLHPELVVMLRSWLVGLADDQVLFPKLAKRRTWLMVKKDLERVEIPYVTAEGVADFHAAGRHTHITELLRKGASLPEAKELARHSDINMTMKYTHIGINDQARAVAALSAPKEPGPEKDRKAKDATDSKGDPEEPGSSMAKAG